jgi:hypothetical protein
MEYPYLGRRKRLRKICRRGSSMPRLNPVCSLEAPPTGFMNMVIGFVFSGTVEHFLITQPSICPQEQPCAAEFMNKYSVQIQSTILTCGLPINAVTHFKPCTETVWPLLIEALHQAAKPDCVD